jgi:hypothetical protein
MTQTVEEYRFDRLVNAIIVQLFVWQVHAKGSFRGALLINPYAYNFGVQRKTVLKIFRELEKHGVGRVTEENAFEASDDFHAYGMNFKLLRKEKEARYKKLLGKFFSREYYRQIVIAKEQNLNVRITHTPTLFDGVVKTDLEPVDKEAAVLLKMAG